MCQKISCATSHTTNILIFYVHTRLKNLAQYSAFELQIVLVLVNIILLICQHHILAFFIPKQTKKVADAYRY